MPKIILYIACSLDGCIARKDGGIDWLFSDQDYGYTEFYNSIGAIVMGNTTYKQSLGFDKDPYPGKEVFVFTRNKKLKNDKNIIFIHEEVGPFLKKLKSKKPLWLVGGGQLIEEFLKYNLIDEFRIFIHPIILGEGIPLFGKNKKELKLNLVKTNKFTSGLVELHYKRFS